MRNKLSKKYSILSLREEKAENSSIDDTKKILFKTSDNKFVESVLMNYSNRKTLCLSTQIGCKMNCAFCATGAMGFTRNLKASEILSQILYFPDLTNIVFMGMGEPLDNFDNLKKSLDFLNEEKYYNMGARRITISTVGIPDKIKKLADLKKQFKLSWSLHSTKNKIRKDLIPISKSHNIESIINSIQYYKKLTNAEITIEFILIKNINMDKKEAKNLIKIAKKLNAKINFIPYNEHKFADFKKPTKKEINKFTNLIEKAKIFYTVRNSKGKDISAACGQLSAKKRRK